MGDADKERLKQQWKAQQRAAALAALPLPVAELQAMLAAIEAELESQDCSNHRDLTNRWLAARGHDAEKVGAWLEEHGGYCDCEVVENLLGAVDDLARWQRATRD